MHQQSHQSKSPSTSSNKCNGVFNFHQKGYTPRNLHEPSSKPPKIWTQIFQKTMLSVLCRLRLKHSARHSSKTILVYVISSKESVLGNACSWKHTFNTSRGSTAALWCHVLRVLFLRRGRPLLIPLFAFPVIDHELTSSGTFGISLEEFDCWWFLNPRNSMLTCKLFSISKLLTALHFSLTVTSCYCDFQITGWWFSCLLMPVTSLAFWFTVRPWMGASRWLHIISLCRQPMRFPQSDHVLLYYYGHLISGRSARASSSKRDIKHLIRHEGLWCWRQWETRRRNVRCSWYQIQSRCSLSWI